MILCAMTEPFFSKKKDFIGRFGQISDQFGKFVKISGMKLLTLNFLHTAKIAS
jgi:hypothetical protein